MSTNDIAKTPVRPTKPYPGFPLFAHATGRWAKKIKGKFVFFGPWRDPDGALQKYLDQKDELHAGRTPRTAHPIDGLTVRDLVNHFLTAKKRKVDAGELKLMSFNSLHRTSRHLIEYFGRDRRIDDITPDDFGRLRAKFADGHGPVYTGDQVQRTRTVFKYGHEAGLLPSPMRFGPEFITFKEERARRQGRSAQAAVHPEGSPLPAEARLGANEGPDPPGDQRWDGQYRRRGIAAECHRPQERDHHPRARRPAWIAACRSGWKQ